mgnify:CR=1 FL=1
MIYTATLFYQLSIYYSNRCDLIHLPESLQQKSKAYLTQNQIQTKDYTEIENDLLQYKGNSIQLSPETNYTLYQAASTSASIIKQPSPIRLLKAVKNETEIKGFHQAMVRDGVAWYAS